MKSVCEINKCNGCMACVDVCPKKSIRINESIQFYNAEIDEYTCVNCGLCKKVCPNINLVNKSRPIEWKQGWARDEIRKFSSSGGVASAIVENFIKSGGFVASCVFMNGKFVFEITNDLKMIESFAGSKYVKSNPSGIYGKIKERLKTNKVLFIGLPCQVAALKNYINNQENLYTIDLICHGSPSVKLLDLYLSETGVNLSKIKEIKFRTDIDMGLCIDSKKIKPPRVIDEYLCAFLESIIYTENCYQCNFATIERVSDITLGDSWGTKYKDEEKKGISLILIQSSKGRNLVGNSDLKLMNVDLETAINYNHQLSTPSVLTPKRKNFFNLIDSGMSFKVSTLLVLPLLVIKQKLKYVLLKCHIITSKK